MIVDDELKVLKVLITYDKSGRQVLFNIYNVFYMPVNILSSL